MVSLCKLENDTLSGKELLSSSPVPTPAGTAGLHATAWPTEGGGTASPSGRSPFSRYPPSLTFAVFTIPRVARLADALVRPWGVLADGVDVAVVGPFHTLVHIWQGQKGRVRPSRCLPRGVLKVVPWGKIPSPLQ